MILTGLGVVTTFWPPTEPRRRGKRFVWFGAIAVAALATAYGSYADKQRDDRKLDEVREILSDQNRWAFFHIRNLKKHDGVYPMYIQGIGGPDGVAIGVYLVDALGKELSAGSWSGPLDIYAQNIAIDTYAFGPGRWRIDFRGKRGNDWNEFLTIEELAQGVEETIEVWRPGKEQPLFMDQRFHELEKS